MSLLENPSRSSPEWKKMKMNEEKKMDADSIFFTHVGIFRQIASMQQIWPSQPKCLEEFAWHSGQREKRQQIFQANQGQSL